MSAAPSDDTAAGDELDALSARLVEEESAYAELLARLDALAAYPLPLEAAPELQPRLQHLNALWELPHTPAATGLLARVDARARAALEPLRTAQQEFNAALVQWLNLYVAESARVQAQGRDLAAALMRYLQRLLPLVDARDRLASALATTRAELILETFDRRQESLARRVDGLSALRDRLEVLAAETHALREALAAEAPPPAVAQAALQASQDSAYVAFEQRFRGSATELSAKLAGYVPHFVGLAPVADLGCGRGEFLELLRQAGVEACGVEGNAGFVQHCRARGLAVEHGDLLAFLRSRAVGSLGGVFAAQVAEHLTPAALQALLGESARVLRAGGLLLLETVNPRSLVGFLEVYNRDLTHERPLHPDTLRFLAAAAGFGEVRVELRTPVDPASRLQLLPGGAGLPERTQALLNENFERLNELLYGPQEYALLAWR